jgi:hypothetical protein
MRISESQMIGVAGQFLTCADLLSKGLIAYPACEGLPYDVVLDRKDVLFRVQVKTCKFSRQPGCNKDYGGWRSFNLVGSSEKKNKSNSTTTWGYKSDEVDIFALVALDIRQVGYMLRWDIDRTNYRFCDDNSSGNYFSDHIKAKYSTIQSMYRESKSYDEIAKELDISRHTVKRIVKRSTPVVKESVYFSSILRDSDWFWNIKMPPHWGMGVRRSYG